MKANKQNTLTLPFRDSWTRALCRGHHEAQAIQHQIRNDHHDVHHQNHDGTSFVWIWKWQWIKVLRMNPSSWLRNLNISVSRSISYGEQVTTWISSFNTDILLSLIHFGSTYKRGTRLGIRSILASTIWPPDQLPPLPPPPMNTEVLPGGSKWTPLKSIWISNESS